ncbi:site-specific integrase [Spirosoma gilvum]
MIRLQLKGQLPARVLTSVRATNLKKYWNQKQFSKWVKGHPYAKALNEEIEEEYYRIKKQVRQWQDDEPDYILTPKQLAERFKNGVTDRYFNWVDKVLNDAKEQAVSTYLGKKAVVNHLRKWAGEDLLLQSVTPVLVRKFQQYLTKLPVQMTNTKRKGSSVNIYIARMHIVHQCVLIKTGVSPKQAKYLSPWDDVKAVPEVKPRKDKLQQNTILKVSQTRIATRRRKVTPEGAFKIWMLAHYLAGMRHSDVMQLRYKNFTLNEVGEPTHLRYEMLKTGNRVSIPVFDQARKLLKCWWNDQAKPTDYILPYLKNTEPYAKLVTHEAYKSAPFAVRKRLYADLNHWNRQMNLCLKLIQQEAGLDETLRMHNARHSFAALAKRIMKEDASITMYDIQMMLGHSNFKTTENYTDDLEEQDATQPMKAIFYR